METATLTLTDFLLARIAEDEAAARAVNTGQWYPWDERNGDLSMALGSLNRRAAAHIARHDPARVLAECEARRRIVSARMAYGREGIGDFRDGYTAALDDTLAHLAAVYSDHPDYRAEWA